MNDKKKISQKEIEIWPNFFIVGASKSGTTSLYAYLKNTDGIYMSEKKEPLYFINNMEKTNASFEKKKYLKLFKNVKNEVVIGEATTSYLADPNSAKHIHKQIPNAKIIILLRDPVERAYSHYLMYRSLNLVTRSFSEVLSKDFHSQSGLKCEKNTFLERGLYSSQVKKYLDIFGEKNVGIWFFEDFKNEPEKIVMEVLRFLHVNSIPPKNIGEVFNPYSEPRIFPTIIKNRFIKKIIPIIIPNPKLQTILFNKVYLKKSKKPKLTEADRKKLEHYYFEDVKKLEKILNKKTPWKWIDEYQEQNNL